MKDFLGTLYLQELIDSNPELPKHLEEIHLLAQYRKGRVKLDLACAQFVLDMFKKVKHFGSFEYWHLKLDEVNLIFLKFHVLLPSIGMQKISSIEFHIVFITDSIHHGSMPKFESRNHI